MSVLLVVVVIVVVVVVVVVFGFGVRVGFLLIFISFQQTPTQHVSKRNTKLVTLILGAVGYLHHRHINRSRNETGRYLSLIHI